MLLKDLMEEKQLNLNQPLLSVRKASERKKDNKSSAKEPTHPAHRPELKSGPLRSAGNVPFLWEKAPGKPKDQSKLHTQSVMKPRDIAPNYPPGRISRGALVTDMRCGSNVSNSQSILASLDKRVMKSESLKEENNKEKASSDSDDETFLDALDTLSRGDSFFMSSSVNSMSGLDDQVVQLSQSLSSSSSDEEARNFIIDRFLPAAQAMISETRQYGSFRKPIVGQEQHQKQVKKVVSVEKSLPLDQHRPKTLPHCAQDKTDGSNGAESYTTTGCGLFPRLCLLNPIPGVRMEDKVQSSSVNGVQDTSIAYLIGATKKHARAPSYRKKSLDSNGEFAEEKDIMCVSEKSKHSTSPHQRGCSKLLTCESTLHDSSHESPVVEKTLYVDSVQKVKSHSSPCSSEMKCQTSHKGSGICNKNPSNGESSLGIVHEKAILQHKNLEHLEMEMEMRNHSKKTDSEKQGLKMPINQGSDMNKDSVSVSVSSTEVAEWKKITDMASQFASIQTSSGGQIENSEAAKSDDEECSHGSRQDPSTLASTKVGDDGKIDLESQCLKKLGRQGTSDTSFLQLQLVLPSLKAPSESWLKRTLPTISSKNIYSKPNLASDTSRSQPHNTPSLYTRLETIVKSSNNVHNEYQRLHKELLTTIPEA